MEARTSEKRLGTPCCLLSRQPGMIPWIIQLTWARHVLALTAAGFDVDFSDLVAGFQSFDYNQDTNDYLLAPTRKFRKKYVHECDRVESIIMIVYKYRRSNITASLTGELPCVTGWSDVSGSLSVPSQHYLCGSNARAG